MHGDLTPMEIYQMVNLPSVAKMRSYDMPTSDLCRPEGHGKRIYERSKATSYQSTMNPEQERLRTADRGTIPPARVYATELAAAMNHEYDTAVQYRRGTVQQRTTDKTDRRR